MHCVPASIAACIRLRSPQGKRQGEDAPQPPVGSHFGNKWSLPVSRADTLARMVLPFVILLPIFGAWLIAGGCCGRRTGPTLVALFALGASTALTLGLSAIAFEGPSVPVRFSVPWLPEFGVYFDLRADGLSLFFALLVESIGLGILCYARGYLGPGPDLARLTSWLLLFTAAMLGLVLAGDLILLVVFWELTSLTSFVLINFKDHDVRACQGAMISLVVTGLGGLALLFAAVLIGRVCGSFELDFILTQGEVLREHPHLPWIASLVILAAASKSAQFPFHFWLARAMVAPTPVSAYLHSATLVKAGIYLLLRFEPVLSSSAYWTQLLLPMAAMSILVGAFRAIREQDIKGALAGSTVSQLGIMVLLIALNTEAARVAALLHIGVHALFKAGAFMVAGIVDTALGSRDLFAMGGLARQLPVTFAFATLVAASMAGLPLFAGFVSKEMVFGAALEAGVGMALMLLLSACLSVWYSLRLWYLPFLTEPSTATPHLRRRPSIWMLSPLGVLAAASAIAGLFPGMTLAHILQLQTHMNGEPSVTHGPHWLNWPHFDSAGVMSVISLGLGTAAFARLRLRPAGPDSSEAVFASVANALLAVSRWTQIFWWRPRLENTSRLLLLAAAGIGLWPLYSGLQSVWQWLSTPLTAPPAAALALTGVALAASIATVKFVQDRLSAILALAVVGLMVTIFFVYSGAPDLALTQILVELVSTLLLMIALHYLPAELPSALRIRWGDLALATLFGAMVALVAYLVLLTPSSSISPWFMQNSLELAGGANVVNVIIVDFRGYDTLGEITVLGVAALIIYGVLSTQFMRIGERLAAPAPFAPVLLLSVLLRGLLPMAALVSVHLYLRGHNLPGGGFIAGLVLAIAYTILIIARGKAWTQQRVLVPSRTLIVSGLAIALTTGWVSMLFGRPFLTSAHGHWHLPLLGDVALASASLFDLGVYVVVVGAVTLVLSGIGSVRVQEEQR